MDTEEIQHVSGGDVPSPVLTFSKQSFAGDEYIQSSGQGVSGGEINTVVDELIQFAGVNNTDGWYGLGQSNDTMSWFGHGIRDFVELLKLPHEERPGQTGDSPDGPHGSPHHRGQAAWVGAGGPAPAMILTGQSRPHKPFVEQFTVGLLGDDLHSSDAIDELSVDFSNAREWNRCQYVVSQSRCSEIPIQRISSESSWADYDTQIDALVCHNPFYERVDALADFLDLDERRGFSERICETLARYERVRCHVHPPYAPTEDPDGYEVMRFEVTDISGIGGTSVNPVNVRIAIQPIL